MPKRKAPRPLPVDVHGNGRQRNRHGNAPNNEKTIPHSLNGDPIITVERQREGKHVLNEIENGERLRRFQTVAVADVDDQAGRPELDADVDQSHAHNDWHGPRVLTVETLAPGKKAGGGKD